MELGSKQEASLSVVALCSAVPSRRPHRPVQNKIASDGDVASQGIR